MITIRQSIIYWTYVVGVSIYMVLHTALIIYLFASVNCYSNSCNELAMIIFLAVGIVSILSQFILIFTITCCSCTLVEPTEEYWLLKFNFFTSHPPIYFLVISPIVSIIAISFIFALPYISPWFYVLGAFSLASFLYAGNMYTLINKIKEPTVPLTSLPPPV